MPGVLSSIFDPGSDGTDSQKSQSVVTGEGGIDLAVDQDIGLDLGVTYQDANGGTHSWQMENDVGVHVDVGATVGAVLTADEASTDVG